MESYETALRRYQVESEALHELFNRAMCEECGLCYDEPSAKAMLTILWEKGHPRSLEKAYDMFLSLLPVGL